MSAPLARAATFVCETLFHPAAVKTASKPSSEAGDRENEIVLRLAEDVAEKIRRRLISTPEFDQLLKEMDAQVRKSLSTYGYLVAPEQIHAEGFSYFGYQLRGLKEGSPDSRMLYAIQKGARFHSSEGALSMLFDPLYALQFPTSLAHYQHRRITLGPLALLDRQANEDHSLRHEIQHHLETLKLDQEKHSLARLLLLGGKFRFLPYSREASADELEAYLREIRLGLNPANEREAQTYIDAIGNDVLLVIAVVRSQLLKPNYLGLLIGIKAYANGQGQLFFNRLPEKFPYTEFAIDFQNLVSPGAKKKEIEQAVLDVLDWSEKRIIKIQKEVAEIAAKRKRALETL